MSTREIVAIIGSRAFKDLEKVRQVVAALSPGTKVLTGNVGAVNLEVQRCVRERGDLELVVISATEEGGETFANRKTIRECDRAVIFCAKDGRASFLATFAGAMGKPFEKIADTDLA